MACASSALASAGEGTPDLAGPQFPRNCIPRNLKRCKGLVFTSNVTVIFGESFLTRYHWFEFGRDSLAYSGSEVIGMKLHNHAWMSYTVKNLNQRGRYKTWHFNSWLTPSPDTARVLASHANISRSTNTEQGPIQEITNWIVRVLNKGKPDCVIFMSRRFSHKDVASWVSSAANHTPLPILPFGGYIQTDSGICSSRRVQLPT